MTSSKASMKYKREESQTEYFDDSQQIELDTLVCDYIEHIENESIECLGNALFDSLERAWTTVETSLRVSQSLINVLPKSVCDLVKLKALYEKLLSLSSFSFPQDTRLCSTELLQVIDPFLNPQLDSYGFDCYQHRNVCLVLLLVLPKYSHEFVNATDNVINQLFRYLMNVLANYKHMESVLYALLTLEMMAEGQMLKLTKDQLDHIDKTLSNLLKIIDQFFTLKPSKFIQHQVLLCVNHLMKRFSISEESSTKSLVKLSSNCQTVRGDCAQCPTVRAQFPASQEHPSYYEVTLQSPGPVIIGWGTRESQLGSTLIAEMASNHRLGSDQYSIGFDGYSRVIWHANHPNETKLDRWKAKDVIGCMFVPQSDRQFHFFLNGKPIDCTVHHYFSHQPYFAAITLYPHQQVYVNFGQQPFKYQPESLEDAIQPQMSISRAKYY